VPVGPGVGSAVEVDSAVATSVVLLVGTMSDVGAAVLSGTAVAVLVIAKVAGTVTASVPAGARLKISNASVSLRFSNVSDRVTPTVVVIVEGSSRPDGLIVICSF
jgi:hypothetical protein